jgi:type I restriction-modification system DNA methylase subunit
VTNLEAFNSSLKNLREAFHKSGRFNDSNAKLDEISKLLAIQLHDMTYNTKGDGIPKLLAEYARHEIRLVPELKKRFKSISTDPIFITSDGQNIFGTHSALELDDLDNGFAFDLLDLIVKSFQSIKSKGGKFDFLNEAFGHFVRDNFRSNIEDAQYMTPQEVVELMCDIAYAEVFAEQPSREITVCDPCCGVGSFITTFYRKVKEHNHKSKVHLVGQDKVPRMVRFTKLNLNSFHSSSHDVFSGNSIVGESLLNKFQNKVDLILTNPPFGARFTGKELANEPKSKYPLLNDLFNTTLNFSSEVLFIDRCISLLSEGGQMLAVVPDSVISSKGVAESLRHRILTSEYLQLLSIIELPTVAFAQAGTRTKTCILHFRKGKIKSTRAVFIGKSNEIGFDVSTRKGVNIKVLQGRNDLPDMYLNYLKSKKYASVEHHKIVGRSPSSVLISSGLLKKNPWTPNHYEAAKFEVVDTFSKHSNFEMVPLFEIAESIVDVRRKDKRDVNSKCISVLHIVNGDLLDYHELLKYAPKYPGIVCKPGDLLFSKINPRIPRAIVVPDLGISLTCSTEFEILRAKKGYSNYDLKMFLLLPSVQVQINHLTSGTSSSHNRIKTHELMNVQIPMPKKNGKLWKEFNKMLKESNNIYKNAISLNISKVKLSQSISELVGI